MSETVILYDHGDRQGRTNTWYDYELGVNDWDVYSNGTSSIWVAPGYEFCIRYDNSNDAAKVFHKDSGGINCYSWNINHPYDFSRTNRGRFLMSGDGYRMTNCNDCQGAAVRLRKDCDHFNWESGCVGNVDNQKYIGNCNPGSNCYNAKMNACSGVDLRSNGTCYNLCNADRGKCPTGINIMCGDWNYRNHGMCDSYNYVEHCKDWDRRNDGKCSSYNYNTGGQCNAWDRRTDAKCNTYDYRAYCNWDVRNDGKCAHVKSEIVKNRCINDNFNDGDCVTYCNANPTTCVNVNGSYDKACTTNINDNSNCSTFTKNNLNLDRPKSLVQSYCNTIANLKNPFCTSIIGNSNLTTQFNTIINNNCNVNPKTDVNFCDCVNIPGINKVECINTGNDKLNSYCNFTTKDTTACVNRKDNIISTTCTTDSNKFNDATCNTFCNTDANKNNCANTFQTFCQPAGNFKNSSCDTYMNNNTNDNSSGNSLTKSIEVIKANCNQYSQFTDSSCIKFLKKSKLTDTLNTITNDYCKVSTGKNEDFCDCVNIPGINRSLCLEQANLTKSITDFCDFSKRNEVQCIRRKNDILTKFCPSNSNFFNDDKGDCDTYCSGKPEECADSYKAFCSKLDNLTTTKACLNYTKNNIKEGQEKINIKANSAAKELVNNYCNTKEKLNNSFCGEMLNNNSTAKDICTTKEYAFDNDKCVSYCSKNLSNCVDNFNTFCSKPENINSKACIDYLSLSLDEKELNLPQVPKNKSIELIQNYCKNENNLNSKVCIQFLPNKYLSGTLDSNIDTYCNKESNKDLDLCKCINKTNMDKFWSGISNVYVKNKALARPDCTYPECLNNLNKAYKRDYKAPCSGDVICNTSIDKITQFNQCKANIGVVSDCQSVINVANNCGENGLIMTDVPKPPVITQPPNNQIKNNQTLNTQPPNNQIKDNQISNNQISNNQTANNKISNDQIPSEQEPQQIVYAQGNQNNLLYIVIGIVILLVLLFLIF